MYILSYYEFIKASSILRLWTSIQYLNETGQLSLSYYRDVKENSVNYDVDWYHSFRLLTFT